MPTAAVNVWAATLLGVVKMKNTSKVTLSALMAALAVLLMLTAYFPYLTYAVPAVAGLAIMVVLIEVNAKWALLSYLSSAIITVFICESEAMLMYVFLFGYYPIAKAVFEKINKPIAEWALKLLLLNAVVILVYSTFARLFGVDMTDMGDFGVYTACILLALANGVFVFYDFAVSKIAVFYIDEFHPKIKKLFK